MGADEIDMVINRIVLSGTFAKVYDEDLQVEEGLWQRAPGR